MNNSKTNQNFFKNLKPQTYNDSKSFKSEIIVISINNTGSKLVNSRTDGSLRLWSCSPDRLYEPIIIEKAHERPVESISWDPNTEFTFATVAKDNYIKIWKGLSIPDKIVTVEKSLNDNPVICKLVKYSHDGQVMSVVDKDSTIIFYATETFTKLGEISVDDVIYSFNWFHANHDFFMIGLINGQANIYQFQPQGEIILKQSLTGHKSAITTVTIDPRGTYFLIGSNEGVASLWNTQSLLVERIISDTDESICCVHTSRDGTYLGIGYDGGDNPIKIYDAVTTDLMLTVPNAKPGKLVAPSMVWFPSKTSFIYTSDNCKSMTYMIKPDV